MAPDELGRDRTRPRRNVEDRVRGGGLDARDEEAAPARILTERQETRIPVVGRPERREERLGNLLPGRDGPHAPSVCARPSLHSTEMAGALDKPVSRPFPAAGAGETWRFVPARWLVLLVTVVQLLLTGGSLGKVRAAGLVWAFAPRRLKFLAAGVAAVWTIVVLGAIAAIVLLLMQLG